jgi:hypothetical protein
MTDVTRRDLLLGAAGVTGAALLSPSLAWAQQTVKLTMASSHPTAVPCMNLTDVFFAEATAWTFVLWGLLFLYIGLMDLYQTYEVTDEALIIRNPMRPWAATKVFDWPHIHRLDIKVKRSEAEFEDAELQVYYTPEGEITIEREDRAYNPDLAWLIVNRADLKQTSPDNPADFTKLPKGKTTHIWNKSGRIAAT